MDCAKIIFLCYLLIFLPVFLQGETTDIETLQSCLEAPPPCIHSGPDPQQKCTGEDASVILAIQLHEDMLRELNKNFMINVTVQRLSDSYLIISGYDGHQPRYTGRSTPWQMEILQRRIASDTFMVFFNVTAVNLVTGDEFLTKFVLDVNDTVYETSATNWFLVDYECSCQSCPQFPYCVNPEQIKYVADVVTEVNSTVHEINDYQQSQISNQIVIDTIEEVNKSISEVVQDSAQQCLERQSSIETTISSLEYEISSLKNKNSSLLNTLIAIIVMIVALATLILRKEICNCIKYLFAKISSSSQDGQSSPGMATHATSIGPSINIPTIHPTIGDESSADAPNQEDNTNENSHMMVAAALQRDPGPPDTAFDLG